MEVKMEMHFELPENFAEAHGFGENSRFIARYDSIADKRFDEFDEESEETEDTGKETEPEYRKRSYLD